MTEEARAWMEHSFRDALHLAHLGEWGKLLQRLSRMTNALATWRVGTPGLELGFLKEGPVCPCCGREDEA